MKKTLTTLTLALLAGTSFGFAEITTFEEAATLTDNRAMNEEGNDTKKVANNNFFFMFTDASVSVTKEATPKVRYYFNDELKATMDVTTEVDGLSMVGIDLGFPDFGVMGGFSLNFNEMGVFIGESGKWKVTVDEGFLLAGETKLPAYEFGGEFVAPEPLKSDYAYVISPDPQLPVEKLSTITITYPEITNGDLITPMGTAKYDLACPSDDMFFWLYPSVSESGVITFEIGNDETVWPAGEYTLTIGKDSFALNRADVDPYNDEGNSDEIVVKFNVTGFKPAEKEPLSNYLTLLFPSANECSPVNTKSEAFPEGGMGYYEFGVNNGDVVLTSDQYPNWIEIYYCESGAEDDFGFLCSVAPGNTEFVTLTDNTIAPLEEEATYPKTLAITFNSDEVWGYSKEMYQKDGFYKVVIPEKDFFLGTTALGEASYVFHYDSKNTGVANVGADSDVYNVYSIDGRSIISNGSKAALNGLGKGLYIINGKKVLVNK